MQRSLRRQLREAATAESVGDLGLREALGYQPEYVFLGFAEAVQTGGARLTPGVAGGNEQRGQGLLGYEPTHTLTNRWIGLKRPEQPDYTA